MSETSMRHTLACIQGLMDDGYLALEKRLFGRPKTAEEAMLFIKHSQNMANVAYFRDRALTALAMEFLLKKTALVPTRYEEDLKRVLQGTGYPDVCANSAGKPGYCIFSLIEGEAP